MSAPHPEVDFVLDWTLTKKCEEVASRVPGKLPAEIRSQVAALISVQSIAIALAAYAISDLFGVGELVTVGFLLIFGEQAILELADAVQLTALAGTTQELDEAAEHLARFIALVGVVAAVSFFAKLAGKGKGGKAPKEAPTEEPAASPKKAQASQEVAKTVELESIQKPRVLTQEELADWYKKQGDYFNDPKNLENHLEGTDPTKPVVLRTLPKGTKVIQYVRADGKPGMYFAEPGTPMEQLGIKEPPVRVMQEFVIEKPVEVVESTAATLETDLAPGVGGSGGGQQLIFPKGWETSVGPAK
jgi:hypothetical protein